MIKWLQNIMYIKALESCRYIRVQGWIGNGKRLLANEITGLSLGVCRYYAGVVAAGDVAAGVVAAGDVAAGIITVGIFIITGIMIL